MSGFAARVAANGLISTTLLVTAGKALASIALSAMVVVSGERVVTAVLVGTAVTILVLLKVVATSAISKAIAVAMGMEALVLTSMWRGMMASE